MVTHAKTVNLDTSLTPNNLDKVIDVIKNPSLPLLNGGGSIKEEGVGESGVQAVNDPNVSDSINEVVDSDVWDALDPPQKSRPHTQQYVEEMLEENDATNAKHVKTMKLKTDGTDDDTV
ncbi:hypothetical protein BGZ80_009442 [Entomortierella chlamydospora]|uniref:Uncharacterized protein n=1 Tax=Entomortierella chlamydospora TaxID=101097 RepID=A0A9P6T0H8_9FUNG|nr:hypothetical protein BGZ79_001088 [Entomortierella chlamydospora]KAG0016076.1 hypothetical protein BGZ80_009442 [Entomortierella chlamydospora]